MITKETVYSYLFSDLLDENWFNFQEDDSDNQDSTDQTQNIGSNTENPHLDWKFVLEEVMLIQGSIEKEKARYMPFADEIRYYEFETEEEKKAKEKKNQNKSGSGIFDKDAKKNLRNFALAVATNGLTAATFDKATQAFNTKGNKPDENKKDKNGRLDKYAKNAKESFTSLSVFKQHAQEHGVPSSLIDAFVTEYNNRKEAEEKAQRQAQNQAQQNKAQNKVNNGNK